MAATGTSENCSGAGGGRLRRSAELVPEPCPGEWGKVEMSKAQLLRQQADTLTADRIKEVLQGSAEKSVPRQIPINQALYNQYFEHQKKKEVEAILEKALAMYFEAHN